MNLIWANFTFLQNCPCQIWSYRKSFSNPLKNTTLHFLFQIETLVYRHPLRKCLVQIDACQKTFGRQRRCEYYVFQYLLALLFFCAIIESSSRHCGLWCIAIVRILLAAHAIAISIFSLGNVILFVLDWIGRCWTRYSLFMVQWRESRNLIIKGSWYVKYYNMFLSLIRRSV